MDRPAMFVAHDVHRKTKRMAAVKASGLFVATMIRNSGFMTIRPIRMISVTAPTAFRREAPTSDMTEVSECARRGNRTITGMTARSCNRRIPTEARPCRLCRSPRLYQTQGDRR